MNWKLKALIQGTLSILPGGCNCNHFLQRTAGTLRGEGTVHKTFEDDVTVLFARMAGLGLSPSSRILEIGTGWLPVFPLSLALAGFRDIRTVDIIAHLRKDAVRRTLIALKPHLDHPCFLAFSTPDKVHARFHDFLASDDILAAANISYLAPCDATSTAFAPGSIDLIVSNNVFEHIPSAILLSLLREGRRLLSPGGHLLHCINCGDHYAYADPSINQINYLQFPESQWTRWNNSIHYQNRLRPIDFLEMSDAEGFEIKSAEFTPNALYLKQLETMVIAPEFEHYAPEQLASTSLTYIATV
jgi:SAM-dependent methyltransferase